MTGPPLASQPNPQTLDKDGKACQEQLHGLYLQLFIFLVTY
jgi:hypothetical protein